MISLKHVRQHKMGCKKNNFIGQTTDECNQDVFIKLLCGCGPATGHVSLTSSVLIGHSPVFLSRVFGRWNSAVWSTNQNSRQLVPVIFTLRIVITMIPINVFQQVVFNYIKWRVFLHFLSHLITASSLIERALNWLVSRQELQISAVFTQIEEFHIIFSSVLHCLSTYYITFTYWQTTTHGRTRSPLITKGSLH